jgi:hypothetical protein
LQVRAAILLSCQKEPKYIRSLTFSCFHIHIIIILRFIPLAFETIIPAASQTLYLIPVIILSSYLSLIISTLNPHYHHKMPSPTTSLSIAQLALYIPLLAPALYNTIKHGKHGLLAWIFLLAFCSLRIIGSGMSISDPKSTSPQIIAGVGLSPLVLGFMGLLHEV